VVNDTHLWHTASTSEKSLLCIGLSPTAVPAGSTCGGSSHWHAADQRCLGSVQLICAPMSMFDLCSLHAAQQCGSATEHSDAASI
jgi:hypothetical protein